MEYINQHTITVEDLNSIDDRINEVDQLLNNRREQVKWKLDKSNPFEDGQTTAIVGNIIQEIGNLRGQSSEICVEKLVTLQQEYDNLQVVDELSNFYESKRQLAKDQQYLQKSGEIEEAIHNLNSKETGNIDQYLDVYDKMTNGLDKSGVSEALIADVQHILNGEFNDNISRFKLHLSEELSSYLQKVNWLGSNFKLEALSPETISDINLKVSSLITLQNINSKPTYPGTWWALDILLDPFIQRFDYHFNQNKETNKLSKPEWAFSFVEEFLSKNYKLFQLVVNQSFKPLKTIMIYQVITSLLVPIRKKILDMVNTLNKKIEVYKMENDTSSYDKSGRLLSHLIFELTSFDQRLRNNYKYNPHLSSIDEIPSKKWLGLTADVLLSGDKERLGTSNWLNFESILANNRFTSEIINDKDALRIDIDYLESSDKHQQQQLSVQAEAGTGINLKPTYSALNLVKLFNNLTSHYRTMRMVKFQLKYVSTIQLKLIESYHDYLRQNLKKFDDSYNLLKVLNLIPGGLDSTQNQEHNKSSDTLKGLEMLTEIFCLAQFILVNLEEWSEELVFIQLWNAYKAVATKIYDPDTNIFTTSLEQYSQLIKDLTARYESFFRKGIRNYLKEYINSSQWDILELKDSSALFASLVTNLPIYLNYVQKLMLPTSYYLIANNTLSTICSLWYEYIITNNKFSKVGAQQLENDFKFIISQLSNELLIHNHEILNTTNNFEYLKVVQSIDVFKKYNKVVATALLKTFNEQQIRGDFDHELSHLRNEDIREVLYRIL